MLLVRTPAAAPNAQVLNVDNESASASVLLFFNQERYLFNAGEGLQRHMREYKVRMGKVGPAARDPFRGLGCRV